MSDLPTKILHALIERSPSRMELTAFLPESKKEHYPLFNKKKLVEDLFQLDSIHYSWFQKILSSCTEGEKNFFFSLFSQEQKKQLAALMNFQSHFLTINPIKKKIAILSLRKRAYLLPPIPKQLLPENECNTLLDFSTQQLHDLIDFLGIYDLAIYLKHVVSKSILTKVAGSLTNKQMSFLQLVNKQPTRIVPHKFQMPEDQLEPATLNRMIHKMGLYRLAGALAFENPDFLWHFFHKLDIGRTDTLKKRMQSKDPELSKFFRKQTTSLIKRMKNG